MGDPRIQDALAAFRKACELPEEARAAFLDEACGRDTDLRAEVESMLAWDDAGERAGADPSASVRAALDDLVLGACAPERIGGYRVVRLLAHGGMGVVFEAEQEHPARRVAIKLARAGGATSEGVRRFELEAQLLARLHHPGIAQIIEAGTTSPEAGSRPFIVMELVEGRTLSVYAAEQGLPVRSKLELVACVCEAVAHAHEHGVVHRDLKPDNVLIDAHGAPRILDFGVARVEAAGGFGAATLRTEVGRVIGTMGYMAPEQLAGRTEGLGPAADVYSLGVMLFELFTGQLPHDPDTASPTQALAILTETDAPRLGALCRELRGDLEAVVAKALELDPRHRYRNAAELRDDICRFLRDEPVRARRHSTVRRFRRFSRRHRGLVLGAAAALLALALGFAARGVFDAGGDTSAHAASRALQTSWFTRWLSFTDWEHRVRADRIAGISGPDMTVELWVRDRGSPSAAALISYAVPGQQNEFLLDMPHDLRLILMGSLTATGTGIDVTGGSWHHIAVVWLGGPGVALCYHNGVLVHRAVTVKERTPTPRGTLVLAEDQDRVGGGYSHAQAAFVDMAEFRVWSVIRTDAEILAYQGRQLSGHEPGLVLYWRLDALEDLGAGAPGPNDVRDLSGHGNHGDVENGAALGSR